MIGRRSFITGLVSLVAAPAIVRVGSLMPVKVMPPTLRFRAISVGEMLDRMGLSVEIAPYEIGDLVKYRDGFLMAVRTSIMDDLR